MNDQKNLTKDWDDLDLSQKGSFDDSSKESKTEKTAVPTSKFYGVEQKTPYIVALKFLLKNGRAFSLPYGLLPFVSYYPEEKQGRIVLETLKYEVEVTGRNLLRLYEWIDLHKVKWIKESATGVDDNSENLFVKEITIKRLEN